MEREGKQDERLASNAVHALIIFMQCGGGTTERATSPRYLIARTIRTDKLSAPAKLPGSSRLRAFTVKASRDRRIPNDLVETIFCCFFFCIFFF